MAKDIRDLFEADNKLSNGKMPNGHEVRFIDKLETALPEQKASKFNWMSIAASVVVLLGLAFGAFQFFNADRNIGTTVVAVDEPEVKTKTLGDVSPDLKKIEDYYVANINLELSKMKLTPENKELFDSYISQLENLKTEYNNLSLELTTNGPDELTIDALISNLKFRLNLMHRLKNQLNKLNTLEVSQG